MCRTAPSKDELIQIAAENVAAVIEETRPRGDQLVALLATEMRKLLDEELSYWYGMRLATPRPICRAAARQRTVIPSPEELEFRRKSTGG